MEDKAFRILSKQLQAMNRHLARTKLDLESLLKEERPKIILRDGSVHAFEKGELERLASLLPRDLHRRLRLPIYIEMSSGKYRKWHLQDQWRGGVHGGKKSSK